MQNSVPSHKFISAAQAIAVEKQKAKRAARKKRKAENRKAQKLAHLKRTRTTSYQKLKKSLVCTVYCFREVEGGPIFYIGQTRSSIEQRLKNHYAELRKSRRAGLPPRLVSVWLESLEMAGKKPFVEALQKNAEWHTSEAVWIDRARADGHPLLNIASVVHVTRDMALSAPLDDDAFDLIVTRQMLDAAEDEFADIWSDEWQENPRACLERVLRKAMMAR